jgi:hypothetical protein
MYLLSLVPFLLQALAIGLDEVLFHRRRGLPRWERIGHPIDTFTVLLCMGYVLFVPYSKEAILPYALLAILSSLMVTKDEFVHKEHCPASEQWLHAILFILHPITLLSAALIWPSAQGVETAGWLSSWLEVREFLHSFLTLQFIAMSLFMAYQVVYWNFIWKMRHDQQ